MFNWITWPSCGDQKQYGVFPSSKHLYRGYLRCHGFLNNSPTSQFHHPLLTNQNTMWPNWPAWPNWPDPFLTNLTDLTHVWPTVDQVLTKFSPTWLGQLFTNFWPTFHQLFTNFSPTWPTFHQLDQIDLTTNNQLRSRLNWIGSALAMSAKIERTYWITTTVDYEPNNCHQSSIWGSLNMRCPFFDLKFISCLFSIHSEVQPMKTGSVTSEFHSGMYRKKSGTIRWPDMMGHCIFPRPFFPVNMTN